MYFLCFKRRACYFCPRHRPASMTKRCSNADLQATLEVCLPDVQSFTGSYWLGTWWQGTSLYIHGNTPLCTQAKQQSGSWRPSQKEGSVPHARQWLLLMTKQIELGRMSWHSAIALGMLKDGNDHIMSSSAYQTDLGACTMHLLRKTSTTSGTLLLPAIDGTSELREMAFWQLRTHL